MGGETVDIYLHGAQLIIAMGAAIMAIAYGIRRIYRMAKSVDDTLNMVRENNETAIRVQQELASIRKEVTPNGGTSLRDSVNRIEHKVQDLEHVLLTHVVDNGAEISAETKRMRADVVDNYFRDHPEAKR